MPANFLSCDRDQSLLLPPDMCEWLAEDHFAWFVIEAVVALDLADFYRRLTHRRPRPRRPRPADDGRPDPLRLRDR